MFYFHWLWFLKFRAIFPWKKCACCWHRCPFVPGKHIQAELLHRGGARGWWETCELTTSECGPWYLGEVSLWVQLFSSSSGSKVKVLPCVQSPRLCPALCTQGFVRWWCCPVSFQGARTDAALTVSMQVIQELLKCPCLFQNSVS